MENRQFIVRERQTDDRRVVKTRITKRGLEILKTLDQPVRDMHKRQFRHMAGARLKLLADLLEELLPGEEECGQKSKDAQELEFREGSNLK
jgi:DNA-binding MarR family transcriptional regulator